MKLAYTITLIAFTFTFTFTFTSTTAHDWSGSAIQSGNRERPELSPAAADMTRIAAPYSCQRSSPNLLRLIIPASLPSSLFPLHSIPFTLHPSPAHPHPTASTPQASAIRFQQTLGQIADTEGRVRWDIAFTAEANGARLYFRNDGISYVFTVANTGFEDPLCPNGHLPLVEGEIKRGWSGEIKRECFRLDMTFTGCNPVPRIRADGELPGYVNYYLPHCTDGITGVREYSRIIYENIYDNIDLEYFSKDGRMKYNFVVRPGGRVDDIIMRYDHGGDLSLTGGGGLLVTTPLGSTEEEAPYAYTLDESDVVSSGFTLVKDVVSFHVEEYDHTKTLVIDPWATYCGGSGMEDFCGIATDGSGNVYISGMTMSSNFPAHGGVFQLASGGYVDAFVVKYDTGGSKLWATYFGGSSEDTGRGISVDGMGNVLLSGVTNSLNFPCTTPAYQQSNHGGHDGFLVKLSGYGTRVWATYCGGSANDFFQEIEADANGNVVASGYTFSGDFPVTPGAIQTVYHGSIDAVVVKFDGNGNMIWSTYLGGSTNDQCRGITVSGSDVYVAGDTTSSDFLVTPGAFQITYGGGQDAFIAKISGSAGLSWSTYYGGRGQEQAGGNYYSDPLAADGNGDVVLVGSTASANFPVSGGAYQGSLNGGMDGFIAKFSGSGSRLWATYYGGSGSTELFNGAACDGNGNVLAVGSTPASDFPVTTGVVQPSYGGGGSFAGDAVIVKFSSGGARIWASFYGGSDRDQANGVTVDPAGNVIFCGWTTSTNFPTYAPAQATYAGGQDVFAVQLLANGTLPVEFSILSAKLFDSQVHLHWHTESETSNLGFEVQRSLSGGDGDWEVRGFVPGSWNSASSSEYSFIDEAPQDCPERRIFYRLKQIDFDGSFSYSPVVELSPFFGQRDLEILSVSPHPAIGDAVIRFSMKESETVSLSLHDALGRMVAVLRPPAEFGTGTHAVALRLGGIPPGAYFLHLRGERGSAVRKVAVR